jgi:hypothetical protein
MFDLAVNLSPWNRWMATGGTVPNRIECVSSGVPPAPQVPA